MLCSAPELGLARSPGTPRTGCSILPARSGRPGHPARRGPRHLPDVVFDLDISPNRPDALCMAGVARDLAAALGEPWSHLPRSGRLCRSIASVGDRAASRSSAGDLCPRFTATILEGVPAGPSPAWMARRLTLAGMRADQRRRRRVQLRHARPGPAQPRLRPGSAGGGGILVRRGRPGEVLVTLDGVERARSRTSDCVICDADRLAGRASAGSWAAPALEIGPATRRVLLEAAWFSPMAIARTGKRLGLHSEARVRFERGVDPEIAPAAVDRFVSLLAGRRRRAAVRRCGGVRPSMCDRPSCRPVRECGSDRRGSTPSSAPHLDDDDVPGSWRRSVSRPPGSGPGCTTVTGPVLAARLRPRDRRDRGGGPHVGLPAHRAHPAARRARRLGGLTARQRDGRRIRDVLAGAGFDEAWTTTFLAPGDLERAGLDPARGGGGEPARPVRVHPADRAAAWSVEGGQVQRRPPGRRRLPVRDRPRVRPSDRAARSTPTSPSTWA